VPRRFPLRILFSTTDVHPRNRFDYWLTVACKSLVRHDSIPDCRESFEAELQSAAFADVGLVLFENAPMTISHTSDHAAHRTSDELFICRQLRGRLAVEQGSRETVLESGDLTLLDPRLPYRGRFASGSQMLVVKVARRLIEARLGQTRDMTACVLKPDEGDRGLVSRLLARLPDYAGKISRPAEEIVANQVLDLFAISLAQATERRRPRLSCARSLVVLRVRAAIEARLCDPTLDGHTIAADAGVSVRYANAVLADENISIQRLIQARRLARCRIALEDPSQVHRTVSEIAYSWGFSDMTHFGRRFKETYGFVPSYCRRLASADRSRIATDTSSKHQPPFPSRD
jgi:AraC family transcriptional activator of tynA and feaB